MDGGRAIGQGWYLGTRRCGVVLCLFVNESQTRGEKATHRRIVVPAGCILSMITLVHGISATHQHCYIAIRRRESSMAAALLERVDGTDENETSG